MKISEIKIPRRTRRDMGDVDGLAASIKEVGLLHLPVVDGEGGLICGERRVRAVKKLGWDDVPVRVVKTLGEALLALKAERDENTCRKDFCPTEAVGLGERLEKLLKPEADNRKAQAKGKPQGTKNVSSGKLPAETKGETRDKVGAAVGMSGRTYEKAKAVIAAAKANPELVSIVEEMDRTGRVDRAAKDLKRHQQKEEHASRVEQSKINPVLNGGPFDLVLADPPWRYDFEEAKNREVENHYPTATIEDIFSHKPDTKPDAILFLWSTAPKLVEALQVMAAWGFSYRSCAVWDKQKIGMGYWFRVQHELLLVGVRGNPGCTPECERISSVFSEARGKHSAKPECVYEWVERAFPSLSKLEMYCRKARAGWSVFGNEV